MLTKRIENAINIFLDAINEGTLASGACSCCAVGNLVASTIGIKAVVPKSVLEYSRNHFKNECWAPIILESLRIDASNEKFKDFNKKESLEIISSTGFTIQELSIIERTFEDNTNINFSLYDFYNKEEIRADQIKGLEAVIKVMMQFDECKENIKEVFTHKARLIAI